MRVIFQDRNSKDTKSSVKSQFSQVLVQSSILGSVKKQFSTVTVASNIR